MTIMQQKRGTAAEWASNSTIVLAEGEIGVEYDTGKAKVGDGTSAWSALSYIGDGGSSASGLPAGGAAGEILAKIDGTDYNAEWIENFTPQVKHEVKLAESISKGQAVYISSANGTNMIVSKASNASEATSSKTMGLLETGGVTNDLVKVVTEGLVAGLDTSAATAGDPVWLATSGNLIYGLSNKPIAPAHLVFIGVVTRVHAVNGEIFVNVQNGFELNEIHNVLIGSGYSSTPSDKDLLVYENSSSLWKNKSFSTLDLLTSTAAATAYQAKDADLTAIADIATTSGILKKTAANTWSLITDNSSNWDTAYTDRHKWDGSALSNSGTQATARTSLGLGTMATATAANYALLAGADFTGAVTVPTPTSATHAVTKAYVDSVAAGINVHPSVKYATTGALGTTGNLVGGTITTTYSNGTSGVDATITVATSSNWTAITIDGQSLSINDRVLIKNQASALQNGIYFVTQLGAVGNTTSFIFKRALDNDQTPEINAGDLTYVVNGTVQAGEGWVQTATVTTLGTDPVVWTQYSGSGAVPYASTSTAGIASFDSTQFTVDAVGKATISGVSSSIVTGTEATNWNSAYTDRHKWDGSALSNSGTQATARTSLGLGTMALESASDYHSEIPTLLGTSEDLNSKTTPGLYHQNSNADAATGTNYPVALAGMLVVNSGESFIYQQYQTYGGSGTNRVYHRGFYSSTWSAWKEVITNDSKVPTAYNYTAAGGGTITNGFVIALAGATAPTARPDGTGLGTGDIWISF